MAIKLYNTLSGKKEPLKPVTPGKIGMYVCGPTVYNYIHIGNARTFMNFDFIRRYLLWRGYQVTFVQNITDVDDKIINRADEEGAKPEEIAAKYTRAFQEQMRQLGVMAPTVAPRATETIKEMIKLVEELRDRGLAYETEDGVYFPVRRFKGYGKLSKRSLEEMRAGERVKVDEKKEDPMDFALWKKAKPGEPRWPSPWGDGRPGWHLECSAMSLKYLGMSFDIHGGARDLIFPHHENEIAQSEGATGQEPFVHYWLHAGLLNINQEKMSKSLGNFTLLTDVMAAWPADVIRLFMLSTHYRNPLDFTVSGLKAAAAQMRRLRKTTANIEFALASASGAEEAAKDRAEIAAVKEKFIEAMDDDFNTAAALGAVFNLVKNVNKRIEGARDLPSVSYLRAAKDTLTELTGVFGLNISAETTGSISINDVKKLAQDVGLEVAALEPVELIDNLLAKRDAARQQKRWETADKIRAGLAAAGVEIEDTPQGARWKPNTAGVPE